MAEILIKGMEMPKCCITGSIPNYEYCPMFAKCDKASGKELRPADCPLVELPQHGMLVDKDAILQRAEELVENYYADVPSIGLSIAFKQAPTVLEASE